MLLNTYLHVIIMLVGSEVKGLCSHLQLLVVFFKSGDYEPIVCPRTASAQQVLWLSRQYDFSKCCIVHMRRNTCGLIIILIILIYIPFSDIDEPKHFCA